MILKGQARITRGFTLTEAAIVLGIVGLILGAIWVAAAAVYNNMRVNTSKRQFLTIAQNIRTLYSTQTTIGAADPTEAEWIAAGVFPSDMVNAGVARNVWNGAALIRREQSPGGVMGDAFSIEYNQLPRGACVDLLVNMTGQGRDAGLLGAQGSAATMAVGTPTPTNNQGQIAAPAATAQCSDTTGLNFVKFTFRLRG